MALPDDGTKPFGAEDEAELRARASEEYAEQLQRYADAAEAGHPWGHKPKLDDSWKDLLATFNGTFSDLPHLDWMYTRWIQKAVKRASPGRLLRIWARTADDSLSIFSYGSPVGEWMEARLDDGTFDIRTALLHKSGDGFLW